MHSFPVVDEVNLGYLITVYSGLHIVIFSRLLVLYSETVDLYISMHCAYRNNRMDISQCRKVDLAVDINFLAALVDDDIILCA